MEAMSALVLLYIIGGVASFVVAVFLCAGIISLGVEWGMKKSLDGLEITIQNAILSANKIHAEYQKKRREKGGDK